MTFLPRLVFAVTLPVAMTTNVVAREMQPPVPKSAVILRDPKASDHARNRKLNLEAGVYVNSEAYLPERGTQTNRDLYILRATQGVEGGYDSVNIYDRGVLSWGVMQWAAHENSLQDCLAYIKGRLLDKNRGRVWASLFKEHGLDVQDGPGGQAAFFVGGPTAWRLVTGIPNLRVLFRGTRTVGKYDPATAAKWAQVFARAGRNPQVQALQTEWAVRNVRRCLSQSVDGDLSASDFTRGDVFSDALLFALWTNNPAASRTHFARAVRETRRITGENHPSRWPQGLFPFVWERVGRTSRFGAWPKRTAQIAASVPVGEAGRRAAKTHLAALGWKPERIGSGAGANGQLWKREVYVAAAARPRAAKPGAPVRILAASATRPVAKPVSAAAAKAFATGAITLPRTSGAPAPMTSPRAAVFVRAYGPIPPAPVRVIAPAKPTATTPKTSLVKLALAAPSSPKNAVAASAAVVAAKPAAPGIPVLLAPRDRKSPEAVPAPAPSPMSPIAVVAHQPSGPFVIVINKPAPGDAVVAKPGATPAVSAAKTVTAAAPLVTKTAATSAPRAATIAAVPGGALSAEIGARLIPVKVAPRTTQPTRAASAPKAAPQTAPTVATPLVEAAPRAIPAPVAALKTSKPLVSAPSGAPVAAPVPVVSARPAAVTSAPFPPKALGRPVAPVTFGPDAPAAPVRIGPRNNATAAPVVAPAPVAPVVPPALRSGAIAAPTAPAKQPAVPVGPAAKPAAVTGATTPTVTPIIAAPKPVVASPVAPTTKTPLAVTAPAAKPAAPKVAVVATKIVPPAPRPAAAVTPSAANRSGGVLTTASTLSFTGLGAVRVGMTRADAEAAASDVLLPINASAAASGDGLFKPQHGPLGVQLLVKNGKIARVDLLSGSDVQTASGARVGDALAALRDRYPENLLSSVPNAATPGGRVWTLRPRTIQFAGYRITFETDAKNRVVAIRAGQE